MWEQLLFVAGLSGWVITVLWQSIALLHSVSFCSLGDETIKTNTQWSILRLSSWVINYSMWRLWHKVKSTSWRTGLPVPLKDVWPHPDFIIYELIKKDSWFLISSYELIKTDSWFLIWSYDLIKTDSWFHRMSWLKQIPDFWFHHMNWLKQIPDFIIWVD